MSLSGPDLQQASSQEQINQLQIDAIREHSKRLGRSLTILEAGCGRRWPLDLTGVDFTLTGIDLDPVALEIRKSKARDLDVAICGDLCTADLPEAAFDVVFSSFVLEHVERADLALSNFVKWLRPGGLLILLLPERKTVRGFYARVLPFWAHVWFYRFFYYRSSFYNQPGHGPYPAFHHPILGRERLLGFFADQGVKCLSCYGDGFRRDGHGLMKVLVRVIVRVTWILSLGYLIADYQDALYIAVKNDPASAQHEAA